MNLPDWETTSAVTITGVLEYTEDFQAKTDVDGSRTAGTDGPVWVIRTCSVINKP